MPRSPSPTPRVRARRAWAAVFGAALLVTPAMPPALALSGGPPRVQAPGEQGDDEATAPDAEDLRDQYEELVGAEADLLVDYDLAGRLLGELLPQVQAATDAVARADQAVLAAEADLEARREAEVEAEAEAVAAKALVVRAEGRLRAYAAEAYMGDGEVDAEGLSTVLDVLEGDGGSLARHGYRATVGDQQADVIDALLAARTARARAQRQAEGAADQAATQRRRVSDLRTAADEALGASTRLLAAVAEERARQELVLTELRSHRVTIEARITNLEAAADGIAALLDAFQGDEEDWAAGAVDVRIPREGGVIGSDFGLRAHPILSITRLHAGVDIAAGAGTPVLAAASGIVLAAEVRGGYGTTAVLAHGSSLSTVYAHNQSLEVAVGDIVEQGDVIARAGSTGLSTGPHIHFETRLKGTPVNPRSILAPGDATWGKADEDGDGIRNARDVDPRNADVPVPDGDGDEDGDGQPNAGDLLGEPLQPG